jgi:hypothetical protein
MPYEDLICLANSKKWNRRCFAGKTLNTKKWIRPISAANHGAIEENTMMMQIGRIPELLDIVRVPIQRCNPSPNQPENYIFGNVQWEFLGKFDKQELHSLIDNPQTLWTNSPYLNCIPAEYFETNNIGQSLYLILVKNIEIRVSVNGKVRGIFTYNGIEYDLPVTDLEVLTKYNTPQNAIIYGDIYLCISLGEPYERDNCCYKLIATIIG